MNHPLALMPLFRHWPLALLAASPAIAQPPPGYYDAAMGLTGEPLKAALHDIISPHTILQYQALWAQFPVTDAKPDGKVWDIYSDVPGGTPPYVYTFGTDQCGQYSGEGDCYNREHSLPQSWFNGAYPMYSDLHHMYPVDGFVNNKRGELPYGEVGATDWVSDNGTRTGSSTSPGYGGTVCEPIDAYKGDLARSFFYMMVRYSDVAATWVSPMLYQGDLSPWAEAQLLAWHVADPVSAKETDRNNAIYGIQVNRNPFIDHPEWVQRIWGPTASVAAADAPRRNWWIAGDRLLGPPASVAQVTVFDALGRLHWQGIFSGGQLSLPSADGPCYVRVNGLTLRYTPR